jgi:hypothetical protein
MMVPSQPAGPTLYPWWGVRGQGDGKGVGLLCTSRPEVSALDPWIGGGGEGETLDRLTAQQQPPLLCLGIGGRACQLCCCFPTFRIRGGGAQVAGGVAGPPSAGGELSTQQD